MSAALEEAADALTHGWFAADSIAPLGAGHINQTYLVHARGGRYVLQRINDRVFRDPYVVVSNTRRVLDCARHQSGLALPQLEANSSGEPVTSTGSGVWRLWRYIEGTRTLEGIENLAQAQAAGAAFARYQNLLRRLGGEHLQDPIPGFLQLDGYLDAYRQTRQRDSRWEPLIEAQSALADRFRARSCHIHGDCKINNLLFSERDDSVVAVVDLDTTMWGHWAWDLGDLARSGCDAGGRFDVARYAALLQGFLGAKRGDEATVAELVESPRYVGIMLAVRFLTDHLQGDSYFKVAQRGDNLRRAEHQFRLVADMQAKRAEMAAVAERAAQRAAEGAGEAG